MGTRYARAENNARMRAAKRRRGRWLRRKTRARRQRRGEGARAVKRKALYGHAERAALMLIDDAAFIFFSRFRRCRR